MFNSFGNIFRLTSFGESHGPGVGGVIDGFPAGIDIDMEFIQRELDRRRPGQSLLTTSRQEPDKVEFLSGIFEGKSTGCPIGFIVWNKNQHSNDYENMRHLFRPSHADFTYMQKYGIRDHRGGGRSSARETISRVVAGALAKLALKQLGIHVTAYTSQVGNILLEKSYKEYNLELIETNDVRCPDTAKAEEMATLIKQVKADGDTIDQEGEEHGALVEGGELGFEGEDGGEIQRQGDLHQGAHHVIKADAEGGKQLIAGKNIQVVLQPDEAAVFGVAHVVEAPLDHPHKGIIGEHDEQEHRNHRKGENNHPLLVLWHGKPFAEGFPSAGLRHGGINSRHGNSSFL